jgi:hypothetical protein
LLKRQKAEIEARLNVAGPEVRDVDPNVAELCRRKVRQPSAALDEKQMNQETAATCDP